MNRRDAWWHEYEAARAAWYTAIEDGHDHGYIHARWERFRKAAERVGKVAK